MSAQEAGLGAWLADLEGAFEEVATTALGYPGMTVTGRHEQPPALHGAYLGLVGAAGAVQIGLASTPEGCQALAKGLMGMGTEEPALPDEEMADAVCEIINIAAGAFKARVRDRCNPLQMGLPVFIHGAVQSTERVAVRVADVRFGGLPAVLLLVHPRSAAEG
ncbi:MAG: chemotaxis protein CheX [Anaeromyxobacteraceae bacterium]|nr:chemotaxis protein CheX [Anaeromyxobacteraceae bacterium]